MENFENRMYEIGKIIEQHNNEEFAASIGHRVFEISLLLNEYQEKQSS